MIPSWHVIAWIKTRAMQTVRTNFDRPLAERLMPRRRVRLRVAVSALAALLGLSGHALAGGPTSPLNANSGAFVRGAAPLPEFHLNFLLEDPTRRGLQPLAGGDNLEIALNSPDTGVFRFLFSPRAQFGLSLDKIGGNRGYAGVTWNVFDSETLFGNLGIAGTYDPNAGAPADPLRRPLGPSVLVHGALEFGYHIGTRHSLSLSLDQSRPPEFKLNAEATDNLRLRYGLKF